MQVNNVNGAYYKGSPVELIDVDHHHLNVPSPASSLEKQTPLSFDAVYDLPVSRAMTRFVSGLGIVFDQLESSCHSPEPSFPVPPSSCASSPRPESSYPSSSPSNPDLTMVDALEDEPRLCSADLDILASPFELATPLSSANAPVLIVQRRPFDVTATVTVYEQTAGQVDATVLQDVISPIVALPTPRFPTTHHPMITPKSKLPTSSHLIWPRLTED
jgi:hypothetical protein